MTAPQFKRTLQRWDRTHKIAFLSSISLGTALVLTTASWLPQLELDDLHSQAGMTAGSKASAPGAAMAQRHFEKSIAQRLPQQTPIDSSDNNLGENSDARAHCIAGQFAPPPLSTVMVDQAVQTTKLVQQPEIFLDPIVGQLGPQLITALNPQPWPALHERSRLASVPVIMYHDIVEEKEVFFDVTVEEFAAHLELIRESGATPISMEELVSHLRTGMPLPEKPVLLTFDDGYRGHYTYVFPLLKQYGYPGLFSIYSYKVGRDHGRPGLDWGQVQTIANDPLMTIASHTIKHPRDLRELSDLELAQEIVESKQVLESKLGQPIHYFTYPEGNYDDRVAEIVALAGYQAALTMDNSEQRYAGESKHLLAVDRIGQSQLAWALEGSWGGVPIKKWGEAFDFSSPVVRSPIVVDDIPLTLISGGKPVTIHADSRYQVPEIIADTEVVAAVDGGFFSLKYLDSNTMIGPVLSRSTGEFIPGNPGENPLLNTRPLVLISDRAVKFVPFDAERHNTLAGLQDEMPDVADAFVAAAWLVKDGTAQPAESFGTLFDYDARRHRAFWGINQLGQPVIGVSHNLVDSMHLGKILAASGLQDAIMLDSGASTSLAYEGQSLVLYTPRPVPHVVGLIPPADQQEAQSAFCSR